MSKSNDPAANPVKSRCPICKKETAVDMRPFCSKRCKDIDLARWLGGGYAIAGGTGDADEEGDDPSALRGSEHKQTPESEI